jgi:hypothetical protein
VTRVCVACAYQTYFNENPEADKLGKLRNDISDVRGIMVSNIGANMSLRGEESSRQLRVALCSWLGACARVSQTC